MRVLMKKISTYSRLLLVFVLLYLSSATILAQNWPIKRNIDLSSGFGDYRPNRFHTGIDLRTGGKTGEKVYAPVSGYVYRVKMAYDGYGKGLYIKGDDGFIYVFGHLSNFVEKIDIPVKNEQFAIKRYYLDKYFPQDSLRIDAGELIGYSGQTGAGAPHLHFEKRSVENIPVNPLTNGFQLEDKTKPIFTQISFQITDPKALYETGERELNYEVEKISESKYRLSKPFFIKNPTGIKVAVFDRMNPEGMKQSVYKLSLLIDGQLYYESIYDSLNFDMQRLVNLEYDSYQANNNKKNFRKLYQEYGNTYFGSGSPNGTGGIMSIENLRVGHHSGEIIAEDVSGNQAKLEFTIIQGPPGFIYAVDTTTVGKKGTTILLKPQDGFKELKIDSAVVMVNMFKSWGLATNGRVDFDKSSGEIKFFLPYQTVLTPVLRIYLFSDGCLIYDKIFNGIQKKGKKLINFSYELFNDGLYINLEVEAKLAASGRVELYDGENLLFVDTLKIIDMNRYVAFIPPDEKIKHITRIGYIMSLDPNDIPIFKESLNINLVGAEDNQVVAYGDEFKAFFNKDNFFKPMFVEIKRNRVRNQAAMSLNSDSYQILPEIFDLRKDFRIELKLATNIRRDSHSGLCWLDVKDNRWIWIDDKFENNIHTAYSSGGGYFASVIDFHKPEVSLLNLRNSMVYRNADFKVKFLLSDSLSGFQDDRSILVRIDNEWVLPEYDPESKEFIGYVREPLSNGEHHLGIEVKDRAGNIYEQYLKFKYFPR